MISIPRHFLSGEIKSPDDFAVDDRRRLFPRFQAENFAKNLLVVARVEELALARKVTPAQLALSWVLAQGADIVPTPAPNAARTWSKTWSRPSSA